MPGTKAASTACHLPHVVLVASHLRISPSLVLGLHVPRAWQWQVLENVGVSAIKYSQTTSCD